MFVFFFFFQAEDGIRDTSVTGVQTCALPISAWTPVRLSDGATYPYGFGWFLLPQRDQRRISHTGSWQGFKTAIARYPKPGLTVIVLANLAEAQVGAIAYGIAGLLESALQPPHLVTATSGRQP